MKTETIYMHNHHFAVASLFEEEILASNPFLSIPGKSSDQILVQPEMEIEQCVVKIGGTKKRDRVDHHPFHCQRQRRKGCTPLEIITAHPDHDGYQWRKYGEKKINNNQFTRCYYRCTYYQEYKCKATKQVQQQDYSDPPKYNVSYFYEHVCKSSSISNSNSNSQSTNSQHIIDFSAKTAPVLHYPVQAHGIKKRKIEKSPVTSIVTVTENSNYTEAARQSTDSTSCLSDGSAVPNQLKIKISDKDFSTSDLSSDQWNDMYEFDAMLLENSEIFGSFFEESEAQWSSLKTPPSCFLLD